MNCFPSIVYFKGQRAYFGLQVPGLQSIDTTVEAGGWLVTLSFYSTSLRSKALGGSCVKP